MNRRGITLIGTLWLVAFLSVIFGATVLTIEAVQNRLTHHKQSQQAHCMAVSGLDYGAALRRSGKKVTTFNSPEFAGGGYFKVESTGKRLISTGYCGRSVVRLEGP